MCETLSWQVEPGQAGERLDAYITARTELTRSRVANLIEEGLCTVNGLSLIHI